MGKKGKFDLSEGDDFNLSPLDKLLKIPSEIANIHKEIVEITDEINCVHKSVANLRPDIAKIVREQLTAALNGGIQG
jgi:hypothetical protein